MKKCCRPSLKGILSGVLAIALWLGSTELALCVGADDSERDDGLRVSEQQKLDTVERKLSELEHELDRLGDRKRGLLGELHKLDLQIRVFDEQIRLFQLQLRERRAAMDLLLGQIEELEVSIRELTPYLERRSVSLYKLGRMSYLRLLLSLKDTTDLTRAYRYISLLARADAEKMTRFVEDQRALEQAKGDLATEAARAEATRQQLENVTSSLRRRKSNRSALLARVGEREEDAGLLVTELEDVRYRLSSLIEELDDGVLLESDEVLLPIRLYEGELGWPVDGAIQGRFGRRHHPRFKTVTVHNGVEVEAPLETPVHAVYDGVVAYAAWFEGYGKLLIVSHPGSVHTLYGYLSDFSVEAGQRVTMGQQIGSVGETGSISGPRLYFEVRSAGKPVNPEKWLSEEHLLATRVDLQEH